MFKGLIRDDISKIDAYKPGKPIEEVRRELGLKSVIKMASNENAAGPSPQALKAITKNLKSLHRYPEGSCRLLKKALSQKLKIKPSNLLFGNGSDELIDVILKTIRQPNAEIVTSDTTFLEYRITAKINGFAVKEIPLKNFCYDLRRIGDAVTDNTKAIFIANPNNPTGTAVMAKEVSQFLNAVGEKVLVVFDEAYFEYVEAKGFPDLIPLIHSKNIVVLRTFSKIYGLAGLRIGYMIADEGFIRCAERVRQPFNVNALAQVAALAALGDRSFVRRSKNLAKKEKGFLYDAFSKMGIWFKESETNFIFIRVNTSASKLFRALLKKGVIIREMSQYDLQHYARITVGTRRENLELIEALERILDRRR